MSNVCVCVVGMGADGTVLYHDSGANHINLYMCYNS